MKAQSSYITEVEELRDRERDKTISIVFPGTSVEGLDLSSLEGTTTIAINEMLTRVCSDYAVCSNIRTLPRIMYFFRSRPDTTMVISPEVSDLLADNPPYDYRSGRSSLAEIHRTHGVAAWPLPDPATILGLDLALLLGAAQVDLYGLDLCSPLDRTHAYGVRHLSRRDGEAIAPGLYQFDRWAIRQGEIERAAATKWAGVRIVNCSPISVLDCFEKEKP